MKKLLIVLYRDFPWYSGLSERVLGIIKQLIKCGFSIKVLAPLVYGYEEIELDVERVRLKKVKGTFRLRKLISLISWVYYQFRCFIKILRHAKNTAIVQFEHYYMFPLAYIVKVLLRKPIIADDINLVHIRPLPPLTRKIFYIVEKFILEKSTLVTTASPITYTIVKRHFPSTRILYLPNAVSSIPKEYDVIREKWIVFIGNLGFKQNVEAVKIIFMIIEKLIKVRQDFRVLIVGGPIENIEDFLSHALVKKGVIRFLGSVPNRVLDDILNRAIIALLPFFKLPRWGGQMTKTLRLMSYGLCVVASPEAVRWIKGIKPYIHYVPVSSVEECVKALDRLLDDTGNCINIGLNAKNLIATYHTWKYACRNYIHIIRRMMNF